MRTTVTLDPDVELLVKRAMKERGISFKEAVNDAIRAGATGSAKPEPFPTFAMGKPLVDVTKSLQIAGDLEDDELRRRLASGR